MLQKGHAAPIGRAELLQKMRNSLNPEQVSVFVIDEVATADGGFVAAADPGAKQTMGNDKDLGGMATLFVGDFNQLHQFKQNH